MRFDGKVAVVTGGAMGIGGAVSRLLAERGAVVWILDQDEAAARELAGEITAAENTCHHAKANVAVASEVDAAVQTAVEKSGRIDTLVVSAGIQRYGDALTTSDEQWAEVLGVNLAGAWYAARACLPHLKQNRGSIVNVASVQSLASQQNVLAYTVSKHGLIGLTRSMAMDYAKDGVRVNAVCPGTVDTPMLHWAASLAPDPQAVLDNCATMHPLGRIAQPREIAEVVCFLAHESASFVTAAVWLADAGMLTQLGGTPK